MPPRRQPPPPPSESKAGLVIALVFFILTTLIGGTLAYLFSNDKKTAEAAKVEAETKLKAANDERNEARMRQVMTAVYVGYASPKERDDFNNLKSLSQKA